MLEKLGSALRALLRAEPDREEPTILEGSSRDAITKARQSVISTFEKLEDEYQPASLELSPLALPPELQEKARKHRELLLRKAKKKQESVDSASKAPEADPIPGQALEKKELIFPHSLRLALGKPRQS